MTALSSWSQRHRRTLLFATFALALGGILAAFSLPVSLFPQTTFPRIVVTLDAGSRSADRMEVEVTVPIEEAVRAVPGVRRVRSKTSRGSSEISIDFTWKVEMISATLQVESAINQARGALPQGTRFQVRRMDPTVFPVLAYTLTSDQRSQTELRELALYELRPQILAIEGIASVGVLGDGAREIQVIVDRDRLLSRGLGLSDVQLALNSANDFLGLGQTEDLGHLYLVLDSTILSDLESVRKTVVSASSGSVVRVEDIAEVQPGSAPLWTRVRADGRPAVIFQVYQQPDGDTTRIAAAIESKLKQLKARLPADVRVANWYDQTELIVASANSVRDAVMIGVVLAFFVLLLFLRDWRVASVAIVSVPVTLAITALVLKLAHQSFNIMTLGGMAAAVGLVIDDALVMIEHIVRQVPRLAGPLHQRVAKSTREFIRPLMGSSMVTIIIFAPMAFVDGVSGAFFKPLALTIAVCLIVSFFIAFLIVPNLTELLLVTDLEAKLEVEDRLSLHRRVMTWVLERPWIALFVFIPIFASGIFAFKNVGSGFMPKVDEGGFVLDYVVNSGTSLTETDRRIRQIEAILERTPEVRTYSRRTGLSLSGGLREANEGDFFVRLSPQPRRALAEVMKEIRGKIDARVPGIEIEMALLMEDLIGDLTASPQPIEIKIFGDDDQALRATGPRVASAIEKIAGVVDVKSGVVLSGDAWELTIDRAAAAIEQVTPALVASQLSTTLSGAVATSIQEGPQVVGVRVWTPGAQKIRMSALLATRLRAPDGHLFALSRVASIQPKEGQAQIAREDLKRMVAVSGRIEDRDMGSVIADVKKLLSEPGVLPKGAYYRLGGLYEQQQGAERSLLLAFGAALLLIFVVLLYLTERWSAAIFTLLPAVGAASASFVGLWLTGIELNITAMMGLIMVVGIVTEASVFLVFEVGVANKNSSLENILEAVTERAPPVIMTSLVASLALAPIAAGMGEGAEMLRPMAITIIAGLIVKLPLALVVLPSALQWSSPKDKLRK